jgi:hypothetical protein
MMITNTFRYNDSFEKTPGFWRGHQSGDADAARRLAHNSYIPGVAPEPGDVLLHPLESCDLVKQPQVPAFCELTVHFFQVQKSKRSQTVICRHHYNVAPTGQS